MVQGNTRALSDLYARYADILFPLIVQILGDEPEAEEALEDTFVQAWQRSSSFDPERGSVRTWLVNMARSRALDRARSRTRRHQKRDRAAALHGSLQGVAMGSPHRAPDQAAEASDRRAYIMRALATLPAPNRQALELAFFGGRSHREVAKEMNQPLGTVKSWIRCGMMLLREDLEILREGRRAS